MPKYLTLSCSANVELVKLLVVVSVILSMILFLLVRCIESYWSLFSFIGSPDYSSDSSADESNDSLASIPGIASPDEEPKEEPVEKPNPARRRLNFSTIDMDQLLGLMEPMPEPAAIPVNMEPEPIDIDDQPPQPLPIGYVPPNFNMELDDTIPLNLDENFSRAYDMQDDEEPQQQLPVLDGQLFPGEPEPAGNVILDLDNRGPDVAMDFALWDEIGGIIRMNDSGVGYDE